MTQIFKESTTPCVPLKQDEIRHSGVKRGGTASSALSSASGREAEGSFRALRQGVTGPIQGREIQSKGSQPKVAMCRGNHGPTDDEKAGTPIDIPKVIRYSYAMAKGRLPDKTDVLQGTLDLMILTSLEGMGQMHGYGIARRIEQVSESMLRLNEGTVYTALMRLQQQGCITATWGTSENKRRARFYAITPAGRRQLTAETQNWERITTVIARLLRTAE